MVLHGWVYVHEYVTGNLSNLWLRNWRRKKLTKKGSQFIWKYFYSENCFKCHYLYLKKHIYSFEKKGGDERSSHCLFLCVHGWRLEDHRLRKKIQFARNIAWVGAFKKVETKYWNHTWCLSKWMKSNFALYITGRL